VHQSGYYAWLKTPHCSRAIEDKRLLGHIKQCWLESGSVYGYRRLRDDLLALGETCGKRRAYRLMRQEKLRSQTGYHRRLSPRGGPAAVMAPNHPQRQFDVWQPNRIWVTNITYIRTRE
jgi:putative transposase